MKMPIKEFASLSGVSVRTLHYYDEIGLLKPAYVDKHTGYRYYNDQSLLRMQQILFYRELDFSLTNIQEILTSPNYNKSKALAEQKKLLTLKKERLERLIAAIDGAMKGENVMNAFSNNEYDSYKAEVTEKWGKTDAYREHTEKTRNYTQDKWQSAVDGLDHIFADFAEAKKSGESAGSARVQELVRNLQQHITDNYYTCTKQILAGLGQMYILDERFKDNIDRHGDGTAVFVSEAISLYCK